MRDLDVDDGEKIFLVVEQGDICGAKLATQHIQRPVAERVDICRLGIADDDLAEGHRKPECLGTAHHDLESRHPVIR